MRISAHKRCGWLDRQKSEVGLMKYHACRRHVAAIAPAEISASLPRQRQLRKDRTRRSKGNPTGECKLPKSSFTLVKGAFSEPVAEQMHQHENHRSEPHHRKVAQPQKNWRLPSVWNSI